MRATFPESARRARGFLRRQLNRAGIEVSRDPHLTRVVRVLDLLGVGTVLDIGANEGQFGRDLRALGFAGRILSFEPLSAPFARLARAAGSDDGWTPVRAAVSDKPGSLTVHIAGNSVSSSALPMLATHSDADPRSSYIGVEEVRATTVDDVVAVYTLDPGATYLKVDVQGFEAAVLDGAPENLGRFAAVQLELSLVPLYEGQALMGEIADRMSAAGYQLWILTPEFSDPATGRTLQCDGVFVRRDLVATRMSAR